MRPYITYQYLLEGADRDWSVWAKEKEANYSGLGPGSYVFRVRSKDADGRVSPEGTFAFSIQPPWYRTTLANVHLRSARFLFSRLPDGA